MLNNKIIIGFIIVIAISLGVCVVTRAEEMPPDYEWSENTSTEGTNTDAPGTPKDTENDSESTAPTEGNPEKDDTGAEENPFDKVYAAFMLHSEKILGALTLIGSLVLAYAYRRGLLPILKGGIGAMRDVAEDIKSAQSESDEFVRELDAAVKTRLDTLERAVLELTVGVDRMCCELEHTCALDEERERMKRVTEAQIDMLYNVFMNSSLPEYQKAEVSDRIKNMRGELDG